MGELIKRFQQSVDSQPERRLMRKKGKADLHVHTADDAFGTPEEILVAALTSGLTAIAIANHDTQKDIARFKDIVGEYGLPITIIPAVESTAIIEPKQSKWKWRRYKGEPKHILAYDVDEAPPCYMPIHQLNKWVHLKGGRTSFGHPGTKGISVTLDELFTTQRRDDPNERCDFVEVYNHASSRLDWFKKKHPVTSRLLEAVSLMPDSANTNELTRNFLEKMNGSMYLTGVTAGSDGHCGPRIGHGAIVYDLNLGVFQSIVKGNAEVEEGTDLLPNTSKELYEGTKGGWITEIKRRRGWGGITRYDGISVEKLVERSRQRKLFEYKTATNAEQIVFVPSPQRNYQY